MCILVSYDKPAIKGPTSIYLKKCFCSLQTVKWALKPNTLQPRPHVERATMVVAILQHWFNSNHGIGYSVLAFIKALFVIGQAAEICVERERGNLCDVCCLHIAHSGVAKSPLVKWAKTSFSQAPLWIYFLSVLLDVGLLWFRIKSLRLFWKFSSLFHTIRYSEPRNTTSPAKCSHEHVQIALGDGS